MKNYIFLFLLFSTSAFTKDWPCPRLAKLPLTLPGCEGEACGVLKYERTVRPVELLQNIGDPKPFTTVKKCSKIVFFEPFYVIQKPGKVKFVQPISEASVNAGDTAFILQNLGEGYVDVCLNDKSLHVSLVPEPQQNQSEVSTIIEHVKTENWVRIKFQDGTKGIARTFHKDGIWFQGYYDYSPEQHCYDPKFPDKKSKKYTHSCPEFSRPCPNGKGGLSVPPSCSFLKCSFD